VDPHRFDLLLIPVADGDLGDLRDVGDLALGLLLVTQKRCRVDGGGGVPGGRFPGEESLFGGRLDDLVGLRLDLLAQFELGGEAGTYFFGSTGRISKPSS